MPGKFLPLMAALLACLGLAACVSQPYPRKNYYSLLIETGPAAEKAKPYTLLVGAANAASGFEDRSLVYRTGPNQFETDFYNELVAAPARLLADLAAQYLEAMNPKLRAARSPGMKAADFGLEIYLKGLYGDFTEPGKPGAVMDIRFTLNDLRGMEARVVLDKSYACERAAKDEEPAALAAAMNECVDAIFAELNRDVEKAVR